MTAQLSPDKNRNKVRVLPDALANQIAAGEDTDFVAIFIGG